MASKKYTEEQFVNAVKESHSGPNGNSIFLPAAGFRSGTSLIYQGMCRLYWSGTLSEDYSYFAWRLDFLGSPQLHHNYRYGGMTIRPVK